MKAAIRLPATVASVASVALALLLASSPVRAQRVSGVVVNQAGATVAGVAVSLRTADGDIEAETASALDGTFVLTIPESGEYRIHADATGHLPTVSLLFDLRGDGLYQMDVEVQQSSAMATSSELPREVYEDWVRSNVSAWNTRDVVIVSGSEWQEIAGGRDLVEALELADFPRVRIRRTPDGFCVRSGSSTRCMSVTPLRNGPVGRLRDISPEEVEAVVYVGPTIASGPTQMSMGWQESAVNARLILFMHGYLLAGE